MGTDKIYPFPVWGTQGGGLAKWNGYYHEFVDPPEGYKVGDKVPDKWSLAAANNLAQEEDLKELM